MSKHAITHFSAYLIRVTTLGEQKLKDTISVNNEYCDRLVHL